MLERAEADDDAEAGLQRSRSVLYVSSMVVVVEEVVVDVEDAAVVEDGEAGGT